MSEGTKPPGTKVKALCPYCEGALRVDDLHFGEMTCGMCKGIGVVEVVVSESEINRLYDLLPETWGEAQACIAKTLADGEEPGVNERMMARLITTVLARTGFIVTHRASVRSVPSPETPQ